MNRALAGLTRLFLSLLVASMSTFADASPVTVAFSGAVTSDPYGTGLTAFVGHYTFEPAAPGSYPNPGVGSYGMSGLGLGIEVDFGGGSVFSAMDDAAHLTIGIVDNLPGGADQYTVTAEVGSLTLELFLEDPTGLVFTSDALPPTPPPLSAFTTTWFSLYDASSLAPQELLGSLATLDCSSGCGVKGLPEPGSLALAALAGLGALWARAASARIRPKGSCVPARRRAPGPTGRHETWTT